MFCVKIDRLNYFRFMVCKRQQQQTKNQEFFNNKEKANP